MKTILCTGTLLISFAFFSQQAVHPTYLDEAKAKLESQSTEEIELVSGTATIARAYYYDGKLIALKTSEKGELANTATREYYIRNDSLIVFIEEQCLTSREILDLEWYAESHRLPDGTTDWSDLPSDCMRLTCFFPEQKFTREIMGNDIFGEIPALTELEQAANGKLLQLNAYLKETN